MDTNRIQARARRLERLERLADTRVYEHRVRLQQRRAELEHAMGELCALQRYRASYQSRPDTVPSRDAVSGSTIVAVSMLAHRQEFIFRLCQEIARLGERVDQGRVEVEQEIEHLKEASSLSVGLSRLHTRQADLLTMSRDREQQYRLDEIARTQPRRADAIGDHSAHYQDDPHV